jgi:hypothetical protein
MTNDDGRPEGPVMRHERGWKFFGLLLVLAAALDLGTAFVLRRQATVARLDNDEREYWDAASNLLHGSLGKHQERRTLGFPLVVASIRRLVGDDYLRVQLVLTLAFSLSTPLLYLLARRELGSERAARLAGLGIPLWPLFIRFGTTLYSDGFALTAFLAFLLTTPPRDPAGAGGPPPRGRWLAAGLMLGLCMHIRPMYLLYAPIAAARALWNGGSMRRGLVAAALLTAGCFVAVLPWSAYLSIRERQPILLCTNDGEVLAGGLNPTLYAMDRHIYETPEGRHVTVVPGKWVPWEETGYLSPEEQKLPYTEVSRLSARRAVAWIRAHPREVSYLTARKWLYMWGLYPFWNGTSQTLLGNIPLLLLLGTAAASLWRLRRFLPELAVFWTLPIYVTLIATISWGSWRFRIPGDVGLIALAAALPFAAVVERYFLGLRVKPTGSDAGSIAQKGG